MFDAMDVHFEQEELQGLHSPLHRRPPIGNPHRT